MEKEISSYPLKYAVLKLTRRKPFAYSGDTEVFAYVPARCALLKEEKCYTVDGESYMFYHVVFTWDSMIYENRVNSKGKEIIKPIFNAKNAKIVNEIYDIKEDSIQAANEASKKLRNNLLAYLENKEQREDFCQKFARDLDEAMQYAMTRLNDNPNLETEAE